MSVPSAWSGFLAEPTRANPRVMAAHVFAELVRQSGLTNAEFADRLSRAVDCPHLSAGAVRCWCDPAQALPPSHFLVAAAAIVAETRESRETTAHDVLDTLATAVRSVAP